MEAIMADLAKYQISKFFSKNAPVTQDQCDQEAARIVGVPTNPSAVQGASSYTVIAGEVAVQFRTDNSPLDVDLIKAVEQAYAGFTPHHKYVGRLGTLHIYTMNNIGGVSMYLARDTLFQDSYLLLRQTLQDYAKFFASAWHKTPDWIPDPDRLSLLSEYSTKLTKLSQGLPIRFRETLDYLLSRLPDLFAEDWPMVPNHGDLLENNIHVDKNTGKITGICDWKDAKISPFGMSLDGLETMLGINFVKGWVYHDDHETLRQLFWEAFDQAMGVAYDSRIRVARMIGILLENGFEYDENENLVPRSEGSRDMIFLDAVLEQWVSSSR